MVELQVKSLYSYYMVKSTGSDSIIIESAEREG